MKLKSKKKIFHNDLNNPFDWFLSSFLFSAVISLLSFAAIFPFSKLDFDRNHDGFMLAPALAVYQGYTLHTEIVGQYGPVTPWVQSIFISLDSSKPLLALRFANTVFITLTIFFLAEIGRVAPKSWKLSSAQTRAAALLWLVLMDLWIGVYMLPWSSVLVAMLLTAAVYSIAKSQSVKTTGGLNQNVWGFISGLMVGLSPFTRINVGSLSLILTTFLLLYYKKTQSNLWKRTTNSFIAGCFVSINLVIFYLYHTEAIVDFVEQSIIWPRQWASDAIIGWKTRENIGRMFLQQGPIAILLTIYTLLRKNLSRKVNFTVSLGLGLGIFTLEILTSAHNGFRYIDTDNINKFQNLEKQIFQTYLELFFILSILSAVLVILSSIFLIYRNGSINADYFGLMLIACVALSMSSQIIPTWDTRHIWWGLPLGLVLVIKFLITKAANSNLILNPILLQAVLVFVIAVNSASDYFHLKREPALQVQSLAKGMKLSAHEVAWLAADQEFLKNEIGVHSKAIYLTWNGYISVINGTYQSVDKFYVVDEVHSNLGSRLLSKYPVVVEDAVYSLKLKNNLESYGYQLVADNSHLFIFKVN